LTTNYCFWTFYAKWSYYRIFSMVAPLSVVSEERTKRIDVYGKMAFEREH
jgi:hypothetical protein